MGEDGIIRLVTHEEQESEDDIEIVEKSAACPVLNAEAMQAFDAFVTWLRPQEEATDVNTSMLLHLRELAAEKRQSARKQSTILSFFKSL